MKNNYIKILLIVILVFIFGTVNVNAKTLCKRAKTLHTEICNQTDTSHACSSKHTTGRTITYGNLGTKGVFKTGDAFDCDVNGDGNYDAESERFYYIAGLNTDINYAVLVYYNNVSGGTPSNNTSFAYSTDGWPKVTGPVTAKLQLPTTTQWKNTALSNVTRKIKNELGTELLDFSYDGSAARLLTYQEVSACGSGTAEMEGYLDNCQFLMENTKYSSEEQKYGYWLENPSTSTGRTGVEEYAYTINGFVRSTNGIAKGTDIEDYGVRPVIEVNTNEIEDCIVDPKKEEVVSVPDTAASVSKIILVNAIICILIGITIISLNTIHKRKRN
ncbi:MAG: hypothetical protein IKG58_02640 [Bacilli bacterium]|nr:hypothetical protein [Bacilli bacterium]MBR3049437.1 hypothetical protein [Bacilli bacterium]